MIPRPMVTRATRNWLLLWIVEDGICDVMGWHPLTGQPVNNQPAPGPQAASLEFVAQNPQFTDDAGMREKYLITYNFNGFLKRVA